MAARIGRLNDARAAKKHDKNGIKGLGYASIALFVYLPNLPAADVEGREQATVPAARIDALRVTQIPDGSGLLGRMADDGDLARKVRARGNCERTPEEHFRRLFVEGQVGGVVRVDEEVGFGFVVRSKPFEKGEMVTADQPELARRSVGVEGGDAAAGHPEVEV